MIQAMSIFVPALLESTEKQCKSCVDDGMIFATAPSVLVSHQCCSQFHETGSRFTVQCWEETLRFSSGSSESMVVPSPSVRIVAPVVCSQFRLPEDGLSLTWP